MLPLWLARDIVADNPLPWQKYLNKLTRSLSNEQQSHGKNQLLPAVLLLESLNLLQFLTLDVQLRGTDEKMTEKTARQKSENQNRMTEFVILHQRTSIFPEY
ncbi:hypothetical protein [uncultured Nostoc sp.]|uniref:hypothetical protein n=1 Tax=uncultured Nostoc sp. TaxID=340711 RepID=UPI0035CADF52